MVLMGTAGDMVVNRMVQYTQGHSCVQKASLHVWTLFSRPEWLRCKITQPRDGIKDFDKRFCWHDQ